MANIARDRRLGRLRRHVRVRKKIRGTAARPRLAVHRTNKHFNMQLIDDDEGRTICAASSTEKDLRAGSGASLPKEWCLLCLGSAGHCFRQPRCPHA